MGLKDRLPPILPVFREGSAFATVVNAITETFSTFETDTNTVQESLFIETANGQSLDLIGEELSIIGRRRGRGDEQYRRFLQGLVPAFDGRGTETDIRIAVAAGVSFDRSEVGIRQDFQNREYQIELFDWIAHDSATTRTLADLADPVAVDRVAPVFLFTDPGNVKLNGRATTTETILRDGLSSGNLEPLSTPGPALSGQSTATPEANGYDLNQRGVIVELRDTADSTAYSFTLDATTTAEFVVETRGDTTDFTVISRRSDTASFSDGFEAPQVVDVRIRNTTTAAGTTDALIGASNG